MSIRIIERYDKVFCDAFYDSSCGSSANINLNRSLEALDFLSTEERKAIFNLNKVKDTSEPIKLSHIEPGATLLYTLANSSADCPEGTKCVDGVCVPSDKSEWVSFWATL